MWRLVFLVVVVVGGVLGLNPELLYLKPAEESHSLSLSLSAMKFFCLGVRTVLRTKSAL